MKNEVFFSKKYAGCHLQWLPGIWYKFPFDLPGFRDCWNNKSYE